jgi:hypothetical protein
MSYALPYHLNHRPEYGVLNIRRLVVCVIVGIMFLNKTRLFVLRGSVSLISACALDHYLLSLWGMSTIFHL